MKGAIIANNPFHFNPAANMTNGELANRMEHILYYGDDNLQDSINKIKDVDYIIAWVNQDLEKILPLSNLGVKVILASGDLWKRISNRRFRNVVKRHGATGIIVENKCHIPIFKKYLHRGDYLDYYWLPWGIDENNIKDFKEDKVYDVVQLGQIKNTTYYMRKKINNELIKHKDINFMSYTPRRKTNLQKEKVPYKDYCISYNKAKISIGGCWQNIDYVYPYGIFAGINFQKNMEICGCNSALINLKVGDEKDLGFVDGKNYIQITNEKDCIDKIHYYLDNDKELNNITKEGFKLVHTYHTNRVHVDNLLKEIK